MIGQSIPAAPTSAAPITRDSLLPFDISSHYLSSPNMVYPVRKHLDLIVGVMNLACGCLC